MLMYENIHILMKHLSVSGLRDHNNICNLLPIDTGRKIHGWGEQQKEHAQNSGRWTGKEAGCTFPRAELLLLFWFEIISYKKNKEKESMECYFGFCFGQKTFFLTNSVGIIIAATCCAAMLLVA